MMGTKQAKKTDKWYNSPLNKNIRELLEERGLSYIDLARYINISPEAVRLWTNGYARPDIDKIAHIAAFLQVSSDFLLGISKFEKKNTEEMTVSEAGLSEAAAEKINKLGIIGTPPAFSKRNETLFRTRNLHILNGIIEHKDFIRLISQIGMYKEFIYTYSQHNDDEDMESNDLYNAMEIIQKAGKVAVNKKMAAQACLMRASDHLKYIIEDISDIFWANKANERLEDIEFDNEPDD